VHQPRVQTQNNKNTGSNICSRKSNYKSTISKSQLSATGHQLNIYIYINTHIHIYINKYTHLSIYIRMWVFIYIYKYTHTYIYISFRLNVYNIFKWMTYLNFRFMNTATRHTQRGVPSAACFKGSWASRLNLVSRSALRWTHLSYGVPIMLLHRCRGQLPATPEEKSVELHWSQLSSD